MIDPIDLDNHEVVGWQLDLHGCKIPPLQKPDSLGPLPKPNPMTRLGVQLLKSSRNVHLIYFEYGTQKLLAT